MLVVIDCLAESLVAFGKLTSYTVLIGDGDGLGLGDGTGVGDGVGVGIGVAVGVGFGVATGVGVAVGLGDTDGVGDGVGRLAPAPLCAAFSASIFAPLSALSD